MTEALSHFYLSLKQQQKIVVFPLLEGKSKSIGIALPASDVLVFPVSHLWATASYLASLYIGPRNVFPSQQNIQIKTQLRISSDVKTSIIFYLISSIIRRAN